MLLPRVVPYLYFDVDCSWASKRYPANAATCVLLLSLIYCLFRAVLYVTLCVLPLLCSLDLPEQEREEQREPSNPIVYCIWMGECIERYFGHTSKSWGASQYVCYY